MNIGKHLAALKYHALKDDVSLEAQDFCLMLESKGAVESEESARDNVNRIILSMN